MESEDGMSCEGILSVMCGLAKNASLLFHSRRFSECLDALNKLLQMKVDDPKVIHNIAVVEYFRDGCSDPKKLLETLDNVKKRIEDLAHAASEVELGNNIAYTDEFDTSIATLNIAVVLFHLHEYTKALSLLELLYQNIEPIDEMPALQICLLLLDVALASNDAMRVADVILYLEKAFGVGYTIGQGENISSSQQQSSITTTKASTLSNSAALDTSNFDSVVGAYSLENHARTSSDETLDYGTLLSTIDITRSSGLLSSNDQTKTSADPPAPTVDLKLKLHLYKVRLLLLTKNLKAAKREIKLAMNIARTDSSIALLWKSQLEYARGNHRKSIKLLMTNHTVSAIPGLFHNNLGCIYHQLKKHNSANLFFSKALKNSSSLRSEKPLKLSTFSQEKSLLIVYNCGLQNLICGKPRVAACCFLRASSIFYNRPLFWLRLAECCLLALEKGILRSRGTASKEEVSLRVVGNGKWRRLVLQNETTTNRNLDFVEQKDLSLGDCQDKLSMSFARQCLLNALHLLNGLRSKFSMADLPSALEEDASVEPPSPMNSNLKSMPSGDPRVVSAQVSVNGNTKDPKGGVSSSTTLLNSVAAYNKDICRRENHRLKQAVLADLSYVELNLENPLQALSAARSLLALQECYRMYTFLGHVYAAEALCLLNRTKEAAEHLSVFMSVEDNVELPYSEEDREKWRVDKVGDGEGSNCNSKDMKNPLMEECHTVAFSAPEEALGTLYVNLASMSVLQGNFEQGHRFATKALSIIPNNSKAVLTSVYVNLLLGKSQDALLKLKQFRNIRFLSTLLR